MKRLIFILMITFLLMANVQNSEAYKSKNYTGFNLGTDYYMTNNNQLNSLLKSLNYTNFNDDDFLMYHVALLVYMQSDFYWGIDFHFTPNIEIRKNPAESFQYYLLHINMPLGYRIDFSDNFAFIPNIGFSIGSMNGDLLKSYNAGPIDIHDLLYDNELEAIELYSTEFSLFVGTKIMYKLPTIITKIGDRNLKFLNDLSLTLDARYNYSFDSEFFSSKKEVIDISTVFFRGFIIGLGVEYVF